MLLPWVFLANVAIYYGENSKGEVGGKGLHGEAKKIVDNA